MNHPERIDTIIRLVNEASYSMKANTKEALQLANAVVLLREVKAANKNDSHRNGTILILSATARCLVADSMKFLKMLEPAKDNMNTEDEEEFNNLLKRIKLYEEEVMQG